MTAWPLTLPQSPMVDGFRETAPHTNVRTEMEQGPAKIRRRSTSGVRQITVIYMMNETQLAALDDFYNTTLNGGTEMFDFVHPRTNDTVSCRFRQPPAYAAINGLWFKTALELEIMP